MNSVLQTVVIIAFAMCLALAGCGEGESVSGPGCVGTVTKTYTEYKPEPGTSVGGISFPSGKTEYFIAVERSDGTFCSKRLGKDEWLSLSEGDTYGGVS